MNLIPYYPSFWQRPTFRSLIRSQAYRLVIPLIFSSCNLYSIPILFPTTFMAYYKLHGGGENRNEPLCIRLFSMKCGFRTRA